MELAARNISSETMSAQTILEPYIIAATAYDTPDILDKCRESGMQDVMFKPIDHE